MERFNLADYYANVMGARIVLPRTFTVGVRTTVVAGGGKLEIAPGRLICRLGPVNAKLSGFSAVEQFSGAPISIYVAWLIPFWFNVSFAIQDREKRIWLCVWIFGLGHLRRTLEAAGFQVEVKRTLIDRGPRPAKLESDSG